MPVQMVKLPMNLQENVSLSPPVLMVKPLMLRGIVCALMAVNPMPLDSVLSLTVRVIRIRNH
ncbi:hypothetical protein VIBNIFTn2_1240009 [Vibrio nigripulchritudo FTn2]|nr:hypothetical protein VIBNIFTn2_1240009 [Vibrio nigripulchritudo FTn2]